MFDKVHDKYSKPNKEVKTYHHYFYEVDKNIEGEYFTLDELLSKEKVKENNAGCYTIYKEILWIRMKKVIYKNIDKKKILELKGMVEC